MSAKNNVQENFLKLAQLLPEPKHFLKYYENKMILLDQVISLFINRCQFKISKISRESV